MAQMLCVFVLGQLCSWLRGFITGFTAGIKTLWWFLGRKRIRELDGYRVI